MRERVEDLGRLQEKLHFLLESDFFGVIGYGRPKDFPEKFELMEPDEKQELLRTIAYGIDEARDSICECLCIARGDEV